MLPPGGEDKKIKIPPPDVEKISRTKVGWKNFVVTCKKLDREPTHVMQFFLNELGTDGSIVSED